MQQTQEEIWHCPSEADRQLAIVLVAQLNQVAWLTLAVYFDKGYPYSLANKYDLVYRLLGCKK